MNITRYQALIIAGIINSTSLLGEFKTFSEIDSIFQKMEERFEEMHDQMQNEMHEIFSSITNSSATNFTISTKNIVTINQNDQVATITIQLPGMKNLDASVEDGVLRIVDLENKENSIEIVVQDMWMHLDIRYEHHEEKESKEGKASHYAYIHSSPTLALPSRIDLSNPEAIGIQYVDGILNITAPVIAKPVHKINVQTAPTATVAPKTQTENLVSESEEKPKETTASKELA